VDRRRPADAATENDSEDGRAARTEKLDEDEEENVSIDTAQAAGWHDHHHQQQTPPLATRAGHARTLPEPCHVGHVQLARASEPRRVFASLLNANSCPRALVM
jgi:hypothetical protein